MTKKVLVAGLGNMGMSHALAYARIDGFEVVGVCARRIASMELPDALPGRPEIRRFRYGARGARPGRRLRHTRFRIRTVPSPSGRWKPARTSSSRNRWRRAWTWPRRSWPRRGAPAASWSSAISSASIRPGSGSSRSPRELGTPLVFRMNLNQQSNEETWDWHKRLMDSFPPIVDCGVHYVRRHVPDDAGAPEERARDRGEAHRRSGGEQLRHAAGDLRRRLGGLVRGGMGTDDERDGVLREGRRRAEGLGLDRDGGNRRRRAFGRHQRPYQDQPES